MVQQRSLPTRALPCPVCDWQVEPALLRTPQASDGPAPCPHCGHGLVPLTAASARRRWSSAIVDGAIVALTAGPLHWGLLRAMELPPLLDRARGIDVVLQALEHPPALVLARAAPLLAMATLYGLLFCWLSGQTPGQRLLKVRVVDRRGFRPSLARATARSLASLGGALLGMLGWVWTAFDRERRAWHDRIARTYVVRNP